MQVSFVEDMDAADCSAVVVTLFRDALQDAAICGWYLGPAEIRGHRLALPYLPRSRKAPAAAAILHACQIAIARGLRVCIVDPQRLWPELQLP